MNYHVTWSLDIAAATPREAASRALKVQRDPTSLTVVFGVITSDGSYSCESIDLSEAPQATLGAISALLATARAAREGMETAQREIETALRHDFDRDEWIESGAAELIAEAQGGAL